MVHRAEQRRIMAIPVDNPTAASRIIYQRNSRLHGWGLKETTGTAAAELDIINGSNSSGTMVFPVTLNPGQSEREWFGEAGIGFDRGVFLSLTSGSVTGSILISEDPGEVTAELRLDLLDWPAHDHPESHVHVGRR